MSYIFNIYYNENPPQNAFIIQPSILPRANDFFHFSWDFVNMNVNGHFILAKICFEITKKKCSEKCNALMTLNIVGCDMTGEITDKACLSSFVISHYKLHLYVTMLFGIYCERSSARIFYSRIITVLFIYMINFEAKGIFFVVYFEMES